MAGICFIRRKRMDDLLIRVDNLKSWYVDGENIIDGASFEIENKEIVALVGSNGSGKTTLIKTITDIHPKFSIGNFTYRGKAVSFDDENFKLGRMAVFSEDNAFKYWTFDEYNEFLHKAYGREFDDNFESYMIDGFNFEKYRTYPVKELSMGNKKKFFIIAAMGLKLPLLILDEPVDGLDFESTVFLYKLIKGYKEYGSILMATHILESINEACDSYFLLDKGKISAKKSINKDLTVDQILRAFEG